MKVHTTIIESCRNCPEYIAGGFWGIGVCKLLPKEELSPNGSMEYYMIDSTVDIDKRCPLPNFNK